MNPSVHLLLIVVALFMSHRAAAQVEREAGIMAGGALNIHSSSFSKLGTFRSCCPEFSGGSGFGWYAGGWYSLPLSATLALQGRLTASSESGLLSFREPSFVADLRDTARVVNAVFQHDLQASLLSVGIEPVLAYRIAGSLDLLVGARAGLVVTRHFQQTETLVEPQDYGTYVGDDRVWVDTTAEIPAASLLRLSAVAGLRYVLPIGPGKQTFLAPELTVHVPLTGVASDVQWSVTQVRLGIALGWSLGSRASSVNVPPPIMAPPSPPAVIAFTPPSASIEVVCVNPDGSASTDSLVRIEQTRVTTLHPLLGHVYFDEGGSQLPTRYRDGIERARLDTMRLLPREALYSELYVIAQRLMLSPEATITCTGTTSGTSSDQGLPLARARAETVANVLISLGVPSQQIVRAARITPSRMTTTSDTADAKFALEENRRVEISSSKPIILSPLALGSTDITVRPREFHVIPSISSALPLRSARMQLRQGQRQLGSVDVAESKDSLLHVQLTPDDIATMTSDPLIATLDVVDERGQTAQALFSLPVEVSSISRGRLEDTADAVIERYQLILFDFNDVTVSGANASLLSLIRSRIQPSTQVRILGATDILGSSEYNADLSLRRAREVARMLQVPTPKIIGLGEEDARFDNSVPEGRAFNRTVIIELIHTAK